MSDRYVIRSSDEHPCSELVDTTTGEVVFHDGMEPEDATLYRDLGTLVDLLNANAKREEAEKRVLAAAKEYQDAVQLFRDGIPNAAARAAANAVLCRAALELEES